MFMLFPVLNDDLSLSGQRPIDYPDPVSSYVCMACKEAFPPTGVFYSTMSYDENGLYTSADTENGTVCDICVYLAHVKRGQRQIAKMEKTAKGRAKLARIRAKEAA